jgi:hypothetical protein
MDPNELPEPFTQPVLIPPLFRLGLKLPGRYHQALFNVEHDFAMDEVVVRVGDVTLREPRDEFPSDKLITQMMLVLD